MNERETLALTLCPPSHREGMAGQVNGKPVTFSPRRPCLMHSVLATNILASDWLRDHDAALVAQARSDALREAADAWQMGEWADAPRRPDRIQERIANAQHVTDWLRARAAASSHPTGNQP